ncbi:MAG: ParA family protein [Rhodothermaceae bacterium]|nr:ParA family protein [Rhodothermaceae bacterium]MXW32793.1 ParA family protein [Rhodothermaceae bacterium]MXZ17939.1 ParA family protein [Rhodothermaceae bacterium]MYC04692.1 ParA family protein [Rhodothermaceae bacterium]MYE63771.1 ParA family protein [Rhodothermaceae bacterium]
MKASVLTFFNNKGGVGKTTLIYHLAWTFASLQKRVVIFDLDPQSNLTAAFLTEEKIEAVWDRQDEGSTIYNCVNPLAGVGDIVEPVLKNITTGLYLLPGDIRLSDYESVLSDEWPRSMGDRNLYRPMRILSSFWQVMQMAADEVQAEIILIDIGPNLGAINRSVLIATDYVVIPMGADLFSLQGLKNLGPTLREWKNLWRKRLDNWKASVEASSHENFQLPQGEMQPIGYLCQQHSVRLARPVKAYDKWVQRIPEIYRKSVLNEAPNGNGQLEEEHCLATVKHYRSLIPMAQEHRKPIFNLTSADGAIGAHANAVQDAKEDFKQLATKIASKMEINTEINLFS